MEGGDGSLETQLGCSEGKGSFSSSSVLLDFLDVFLVVTLIATKLMILMTSVVSDSGTTEDARLAGSVLGLVDFTSVSVFRVLDPDFLTEVLLLRGSSVLDTSVEDFLAVDLREKANLL